MRKAYKYCINGALICGFGNALLEIIKQSNNGPDRLFNWPQFWTAMGKGAVVGGGVGLVTGAIVDYFNDKEKPIKTDPVLLLLANKVRLESNDPVYRILDEKARWITHLIISEFGSDLLGEPYRFGSSEKRTALKEKFDIDICIPGKSSAFSSTAVMYNDFFEFLKGLEGSNGIVRVRRQSKTIGIILLINGTEQKIDVLPNRITRRRGNHSSGYIYVNKSGLLSRSTYTKTNPRLLNDIRLSETQKRILVVLKDWKLRENIPISSHLLQYLILDGYSYNKCRIPNSFSEKLIMVLEYIANNIDSTYISSVENTNNIISNIPSHQKGIIRTACKEIVEDYEYQPNSILKHFPNY